MTTTLEVQSKTMELLPKLDCGACGYKTCIDFAISIDNGKDILDKCIHVADKVASKAEAKDCFICAKQGSGMGDKLGWKDNLKRDFDFILDCFPNEPGPKETILPYNPTLVTKLPDGSFKVRIEGLLIG
ncbi:MAG: (Fe-S)-binding protein [Bacteroidota bacterium]